MAINKFEENIQKELEALKLAPTAEVWEKVEAQIRKEKKRRFILLFFMCLLGFFVAGLFWLNKKDVLLIPSVKKQDAVSVISKDTNTIAIPNHTIVATEQTKVAVKNNPVIATAQSDVESNKTIRKTSATKSKSRFKLQQQNVETATENAGVLNKQSKKRDLKGRIRYTSKAAEIEDASVQEENKKDSSNTFVAIDSTGKNITKKDTAIQLAVAVTKDTPMNKPVIKNVVKNKQAIHKWKFGYTVDITMAGTLNGYPNNSNTLNSSTSSAFPGNMPQFNSSAKTLAGIGFSAGLLAEREISANTSLSFGLNYRLSSTVLKSSGFASTQYLITGQPMDRYHNYFHFIELPVEVQSKIKHSKQWPFYWSAGIVFSELIDADALQFSTSNGHYYSDNSLFNKTGIGLTAGLYFGVGQNGKMPFQIGPALYYSLTNMATTGAYSQAHYAFAGIRLKKMLRKK